MRIFWSFITVTGIAVAGLVAANAIDYYRFTSAIRRVEQLSESEFRALGDAAGRIDSQDGTTALQVFESLRPLRASLRPEHSEFLLYELNPKKPRWESDGIYLYFVISTSPSNQQIYYFTNSDGSQRTKVLWNRNPDFVRLHEPTNRVVTITQWSADGRSWIVLKDRLLVVDQTGYVGGEPSIAASIVLDSSARSRIEAAIASIPASARGKDYRADGVIDGVSLDIRFTADGSFAADEITVSNTWVEELRPLLETISELSPPDCAVTFIEHVTADEYLSRSPRIVRSLAERDELMWGEPNTPWWCVWRQLRASFTAMSRSTREP